MNDKQTSKILCRRSNHAVAQNNFLPHIVVYEGLDQTVALSKVVPDGDCSLW